MCCSCKVICTSVHLCKHSSFLKKRGGTNWRRGRQHQARAKFLFSGQISNNILSWHLNQMSQIDVLFWKSIEIKKWVLSNFYVFIFAIILNLVLNMTCLDVTHWYRVYVSAFGQKLIGFISLICFQIAGSHLGLLQ